MSAPPWVVGAPAFGVLDGDVEDAPEAVPLARAPSREDKATGQEKGTAPGQWDEPSYYGQPRPNPGRRWAFGLAVLLSIAAPAALVIALTIHY